MSEFFRSHSLVSLRQKLVVLYFLNVIDILFTYLLLSTGWFVEANILMVKVVQSTSASILLKVVLPALLLVYIIKRLAGATQKQLSYSNIIINTINMLYGLVVLSHIAWMIIYYSLFF